MFSRRAVDRRLARHQGIALHERRGQIFFDREPAPMIRLEDESLQVHLAAAACFGKLTVERANLR